MQIITTNEIRLYKLHCQSYYIEHRDLKKMVYQVNCAKSVPRLVPGLHRRNRKLEVWVCSRQGWKQTYSLPVQAFAIKVFTQISVCIDMQHLWCTYLWHMWIHSPKYKGSEKFIQSIWNTSLSCDWVINVSQRTYTMIYRKLYNAPGR